MGASLEHIQRLVSVVFKTWGITKDVETDKRISDRPANLLLLLRYYHQRTAERSEYYIFEVDLEVIRLHTVGDASKGVYSILLRQHLLVLGRRIRHAKEAQPPM